MLADAHKRRYVNNTCNMKKAPMHRGLSCVTIFSSSGLRLAPHRAEAIVTVDWPIATGLKGNCRIYTTLGAHYWMHFSRSPASGSSWLVPPSGTALGTTGRFIGKPFGYEELLLTHGKGKVITAPYTCQVLI